MYEKKRWLQRYQNYQRALYHLDNAIKRGIENLNELEQQGLIKGFELVYELAWKTLQDYLHEIGYMNINGPRPVIEQAFKDGLISDGNAWLEMHESRNDASHIYNEDLAFRIVERVAAQFYLLFDELDKRFASIKKLS